MALKSNLVDLFSVAKLTFILQAFTRFFLFFLLFNKIIFSLDFL